MKRLTTLSFLIPLGIMATGSLYLLGALRLGFGTLSMPGEGFIPVIFGVLLFAGSIMLVIGALVKPVGVSHASQDVERGKDLFALLAVIWGYVIILPFLGYVFCTLVLVIASAWIMRSSWWLSILLGVVITLISYILFGIWLHIPLPSSSLI